MAKRVELFYFEGCPSWERALENLEEAQRLEGVSTPVQKVLVPSVEEVQAKRFLGSPTIRIDGVDLDGPEADKRPFMLGCRLYREGDQSTGWPSVAVIRRALQHA
jgi:hypothetical protein